MQVDLSVLVPCHNEESNLNELTVRLSRLFVKKKINGEIIFVNDGSKDYTKNVLNEISNKNNMITIEI